jgi:hypothetical protein
LPSHLEHRGHEGVDGGEGDGGVGFGFFGRKSAGLEARVAEVVLARPAAVHHAADLSRRVRAWGVGGRV